MQTLNANPRRAQPNYGSASRHLGRSVRSVHIIPAAPGWALAIPITDLSSNRVTGFQDEPLIGWAIEVLEPEDDQDSVVVVRNPIVADPCCEPDECLWRRPDRSLFSPLHCEYTSDEAAIADLQKLEDAASARKAPLVNG